MKLSEFLFTFVILTLLVRYAGKYWVENKSYIFDGERVASIAKKYTGKSTETQKLFKPEDAMKKVVKDLRKQYPGHILPDKDLQWIFVNAGGWMGSFCLLHASFTEYVMLFGTAIETAGHSGRHWVNATQVVLTGSVTTWKEGELSTLTYNPGDTIYVRWGEASAINIAAGTFGVEYGRGLHYTSFPFMMSDTFFSTHDFSSMFKMLRIAAIATWHELQFYVGQYLG